MGWFLQDSGKQFELFGVSHLIVLAIYFLSFFLLIYYRKQIQEKTTLFSVLRWSALIILISMELIFQVWGIMQGMWPYQLPFHLCAVAGIIAAITLYTLNDKLIIISFYLCLTPAFLALLTPDLAYDFPSVRFHIFFIQHMVISLCGLFFAIIARPGTISKKSPLMAHFYLLLYAIFVHFIINDSLDANYLYLSHPPVRGTALDLFGSGWIYRLNLVITALVVFYMQFGLYKLVTRRSN